MANVYYNLPIPFIGPIFGTLSPGYLIIIRGTAHPSCARFSINLQCGPGVFPRDDVSLHIGVDFTRGAIVRNSIQGGKWGVDEAHGYFVFARGAPFEVLIQCVPTNYNIAINGQHFTSFEHRIVFHRVTHLAIDGDVLIGYVEFVSGPPNLPPQNVRNPQPVYATTQVHTAYGPPQYGPPQYGPPQYGPPQYGPMPQQQYVAQSPSYQTTQARNQGGGGGGTMRTVGIAAATGVVAGGLTGALTGGLMSSGGDDDDDHHHDDDE